MDSVARKSSYSTGSVIPMATIKAEFVLNDKGHPKMYLGGELHHYMIRLRVSDTSYDVTQVTYKLHDSYYDP